MVPEEQILNLTAYIKSLQSQPVPAKRRGSGASNNGEEIIMNTLGAPINTGPAVKHHHLNASYGIRSWLLTADHKRIALLYLASVTFFFFIGGFFAMMIRLHLMSPYGYSPLARDTYNRMFTMHGVTMIFFFLIPSIPAVLGNFLIPLMVGAKDLAFPKINLLSWYIYVVYEMNRLGMMVDISHVWDKTFYRGARSFRARR